MNRRGISSIISVSLITLGAIIGVALLWTFVSRNIDNAKNEITDPDCLTIDLEVVSCNAFGACGYESGISYYEADLIVKRNVGRGNVTALRFIFESPNGIKGVIDRDIPPNVNLGELGSLSFIEPYEGIGIPVYPGSVKIAALIGQKKDVCPVASRDTLCPIMTGLVQTGSISNVTYNLNPSNFVYNRRADSCCQHPVNFSSCYDGGDINYPINAQGISINGLPGFNTSLCCQYNPENGGPRQFVP